MTPQIFKKIFSIETFEDKLAHLRAEFPWVIFMEDQLFVELHIDNVKFQGIVDVNRLGEINFGGFVDYHIKYQTSHIAYSKENACFWVYSIWKDMELYD